MTSEAVVQGVFDDLGRLPPLRGDEDVLRNRLRGTRYAECPISQTWLAHKPPAARKLLEQALAATPSIAALPCQRLSRLAQEQLLLVLDWDLPEGVRRQVREWFDEGCAPRHVVRAFTKLEPLAKAPRVICPMEAWMNTFVGPSISFAERVLGTCPHFVKGMNIEERTDHMKRTVLQSGIVFAETDYSAFDSTVHLRLRQLEYECFRPFWLSDDAQLAWILLICNTVIRHVELSPEDEFGNLVIPSMRYSGEPGTSIGNGIINLYGWWSCPERGLGGFALAEGDDGFVGSSSPYDLAAHVRRLGLDMKIDWHCDPTEVKFCGRYLARIGTTVISLSDVRRQLDKFHVSFTNSSADVAALLRGKCMANLALDSTTPGVAWASYAHLQRLGDGVVAYSEADRYRLELSGVGSGFVAPRPSLTFDHYESAKAQGLDPIALREFDQRMELWGAGVIDDKPTMKFSTSNVKVDMDVVSVLSRC
nr:RNA-dependent RNA polymerase [Tolivirales sp.]